MVELLVEFVLFPEAVGWAFWVMVVRIDETSVVDWRSGPRVTTVDKKVDVMTTGRELPPPPLEEGVVGFPLPEEDP